METLNVFLDQAPDATEAIHNVYDLPSIAPAIRYLHAAAGFPTKSTWLKSIHNKNYLTWPPLTVKNLNKYFPEPEETQQGHMKSQRQGVCSTKAKIKVEDKERKGDQDEKEGKKMKSHRNQLRKKTGHHGYHLQPQGSNAY